MASWREKLYSAIGQKPPPLKTRKEIREESEKQLLSSLSAMVKSFQKTSPDKKDQDVSSR